MDVKNKLMGDRSADVLYDIKNEADFNGICLRDILNDNAKKAYDNWMEKKIPNR